MSKLHLVFGGRVKDPRGVDFDLNTLDLVGIYDSYAAAEDAWRGRAQRTVDEIRSGVNAGTQAVRELLDDAELFTMRTGEDARALGRSPRAQLYQVVAMPTAVLIDTAGVIETVRMGFRPGESGSLEKKIRAHPQSASHLPHR